MQRTRWPWMLASLLAAMWLVSAHAQTCGQKATLNTSADIYQELPHYVTGLGWQGPRTDRLPAGSVVWICQDRAVDFGFSSKTWSQIGYRAPRNTDPWRFGWILKEQWRPILRPATTSQSREEGQAHWAAYNAKAASEPQPNTASDIPTPASPDAPPTLPAAKSSPEAMLDTPPESASLSEQIVLYGPLFLAMLLGMLAKALFDVLDDTQPSWREHLRHGAMAIVISPIVFLGFITAGQFNSSSQTFLVLALFAFQNGFFWQTVLKRNPPAPGKPA